jgi:hypothetical protein
MPNARYVTRTVMPSAQRPGLVAVTRSSLPGSVRRTGPPASHAPLVTVPSVTAAVDAVPSRPHRSTHATWPSLAKYASTARGVAAPATCRPNTAAYARLPDTRTGTPSGPRSVRPRKPATSLRSPSSGVTRAPWTTR